jgi:RpiR family carbohydrate utilization transcriptional regulator
MTRKLANVFAETLLGTQKRLDAVAVERAVEVLGNASKVVFVGVGGAAPICDEAAHMLLKMGKDTVSHRDGYTQAIVAANLGPGTAMVGVSHTGSTATVAQALALARHNGADTIAITSDPKSQVALAAEIVLQTWHHTALQIPLYGDFLEGRFGQLFLIDVIYLGLLFRDGHKARERLETTTAALETFSITQRRAPRRADGGGRTRPSGAAIRQTRG